ncbi:hypothetical protein [Streptomyces goshikiensis]|uniref:hypothetical protein n=1 Tax=Streptomyces goshikiensis TaxID=1942 RepID=UPI0036658538
MSIPDTAHPQLAAHYSRVAESHLDLITAHRAIDPELIAGQAVVVPKKYTYSGSVHSFSVLGGGFSGDFTDEQGVEYEITGAGGGLSIGGGDVWGTLWTNGHLRDYAGWTTRFETTTTAAMFNINLCGLDGEYIGSFVGGGAEMGVGAMGGQGKIDIKH